MASSLFLPLLGIGIWLMTRKRAKWFFTAAGGLYLALFVVTLSMDGAQSGALTLEGLLAGVVSLYFAECLVFLGIACFCFRR